MHPAVPKRMKIGGNTAHHNRMRYLEAKYWNSKDQEFIDGIFFADESKMTFKMHKNRSIDIKWVLRGNASESNWYEDPRHPGQINLFLMQSKEGIEYSYIYEKNMKKSDYKNLLPIVGRLMREAGDKATVYMHDNLWRGGEPVEELNQFIGEGKWTRYMGKPCTKKHRTMKTPKRNLAVRVPKLRCRCATPQDSPIHASYNPKLNLIEETFAKIDRQMTKNQINDKKIGILWPQKGATAFWKMQLDRSIFQVNNDKQYFINQYKTFKKRCQGHIKSKGKRLKTSKY